MQKFGKFNKRIYCYYFHNPGFHLRDNKLDLFDDGHLRDFMGES